MAENDIPLPGSLLTVLADAKRLATLAATGVIDGAPSEVFNGLAMMASLIFEAPIAQVTFIDAETQYFKSSIGLDMDAGPAMISFCAHTFADQKSPTVVLNAAEDKRFSSNPYVLGEPYVRFYAGCPIVVDSQPIGTVCVYDFQVRTAITPVQNQMIALLAQNASSIAQNNK